MPFIPRQVKPPTRIAITCKLPQQVATLLKCYAEFLESSQEYVVTETLQLAFRKDREFQAWLTTTYPDTATALGDGSSASRDPFQPALTGVPARSAPASNSAATPSRPPASQER